MFDDLDDPRKQAMLAAAFGLLGGQGGKGFGGFARDAGQAGLLGMRAYTLADEGKRRNATADLHNKMLAEQYKQAQRSTDYQNNFDALAKRHFNAGSPAIPYNDTLGDGQQGNVQEAQAPMADFQGFMSGLPALGGQGVKDAIALQQLMAKDSAFSKIDPKDYTPESIRRFAMSAQGGKPDFSILEPVRKREVVDGRVIDPYSVAPGSEVSGPQSGVVPNGRGGYMFNPAKINPVEVANFNLSRAKAADEGVGNLPGLPGFITGGVSGPISRPPMASPQQAPQGGSMAPVAAPGGIPPSGQSSKSDREAAAGLMAPVVENWKALYTAPVDLENIAKAKKIALSGSAANFQGQSFANLKLGVVKSLNNALGLNIDPNGVANAEELGALGFQQVLGNLKKMDSQPSQKQQEILQQAMGSLTTDPKALPRVLDIVETSLRGRVDAHNSHIDNASQYGAPRQIGAYRIKLKPYVPLPDEPVVGGPQNKTRGSVRNVTVSNWDE